jgi:DNA-binding beta-propeller fold protein YncE
VLGVIDAESNTLIEKIPQGSGSHSVAADSKRNLIFVPQVAPVAVVGAGGDTTTVGQNLCGSMNGCVVVFQHKVKSKDDGDEDEDDHDDVAENHHDH